MLTLLCANLSLDPDQIASWPPTVARRLARARVLSASYDDQPIPLLTPAEAWLKREFSVPENPALTVSAYQRYCFDPESDSPPGAGQVLTATPAYLHATLDHLVLSPSSELTLSNEHASELAAAANDFLAHDGIVLRVLAPECWLLTIPAPLNVELRGSLQASGRNIHAYMPSGQDGRRLRALLNELQMLWHDHPVNQTRAENGEVPINSLWIEGTVGSCANGNARPEPSFAHVISDSLVTRGLAIACRVARTEPLPVEVPGGITEKPETLIELSGPDAMEHLAGFLSTRRSPIRLVLCDDRRRLELLSALSDKLRFWRRNALRTPALESS